jgi:hypothetical protein
MEPNITQKEKQTNTEGDEMYKVTENPPNEDVQSYRRNQTY